MCNFGTAILIISLGPKVVPINTQSPVVPLCLLLDRLHNSEPIINDEWSGRGLPDTWIAYFCSLPLHGISPLATLSRTSGGIHLFFLRCMMLTCCQF